MSRSTSSTDLKENVIETVEVPRPVIIVPGRFGALIGLMMSRGEIPLDGFAYGEGHRNIAKFMIEHGGIDVWNDRLVTACTTNE